MQSEPQYYDQRRRSKAGSGSVEAGNCCRSIGGNRRVNGLDCIEKLIQITKSSITETPGKAPEKGSAGSFLQKRLRVLSLPLRRIAQGILLHPFSTLIIEDKQDRCNGPGQWIGKCHCCDLVPEGTAIVIQRILRTQTPKQVSSIGKKESPQPRQVPERISIQM